MSLRKQLLLTLLATLSAVWLCFASLTYLYMREEVDELFNHQLQQTAATLTDIDIRHLATSNLSQDSSGYDTDDRFVVYLWDAAGKPLFLSPQAPELKFFPQSPRWREAQYEGNAWRVWQFFHEPQQRWIAVGRELNERDELLNGLLFGLFLPWFFSLMLVMWLVWMLIDRVIGKLDIFATEVGERRLDDLSPMHHDAVPLEVRPLVLAFNQLLQRLHEAAQNERRFTSDAAHELRTPLAAIRVQAEAALQGAQSVENQGALQSIVLSVTRAGHTLEQLLQLARLDSVLLPELLAEQDMHALLRDVMAEYAVSAHDAQIELSLDAQGALLCEVHAEWMRIALRNLIGNALKYAKTQVQASILMQQESLLIRIHDDGIGVPPESLVSLGERFHRLSADKNGMGLGLSIVKRIIELHDGELQFFNENGLVVVCSLPVRHR